MKAEFIRKSKEKGGFFFSISERGGFRATESNGSSRHGVAEQPDRDCSPDF